MKKRPNLVLREPVKLYESNIKEESKQEETYNLREITEIPEPTNIEKIKETPVKKEVIEKNSEKKDSIKEKLPPRISQIWSYFCRKAKTENGVNPVFSLTRAEVMKGAGIGSTNTYRDALKRFQDLGLLEIELRPGVNSGSIFTLTEKGINELD